jgi:hypothetical protein
MFAHICSSSNLARRVALAALIVAGLSSVASAQTPLATGSILRSNRSPWGTVEVYEGGKLGVWLRIIYNGRRSVMTVMPDVVTSDGRITGKFINYDLPGFSGQGNPAEFANWVENGGGDFATDPFTLGATELSGQMAFTYAGTQNMRRIPIQNPQFEGFILTSP